MIYLILINIWECINITNKKDLLKIFNEIKEFEIVNKLKPIVNEENDTFCYVYQKSHYVFLNNVTIAFNKVQFDKDNLRFYMGEEAVGAIAILNIETISI